MMRILIIFIFVTFYSGFRAQTHECSVVFNHLLITVDSTTYQAILGSEILNSDFAFAYERNKNWDGIYLIGQDNYIEIFHPKSISNEHLPTGFTWICHASLFANCIEKYDLPDNQPITYSSDESYDELSVNTLDSSNLMTTRELNEKQYESWTKKIFNDSLNFQTVDYNSPAESDSSKNYLFNNVTGIEINLNASDSVNITHYLNLIGYSIESKSSNSLRFTNSKDFIVLHFFEKVEIATISVIHFKLNKPTTPKHLSLGNSEMVIENSTGRWEINKLSLSKNKKEKHH